MYSTMRICDRYGSRSRTDPCVPSDQGSVPVGADQLLAIREPRDGTEWLSAYETRVGRFGFQVPKYDQSGFETHQQL